MILFVSRIVVSISGWMVDIGFLMVLLSCGMIEMSIVAVSRLVLICLGVVQFLMCYVMSNVIFVLNDMVDYNVSASVYSCLL